MSNVVQYVLVRGDLTRVLKWPSGAVMAQACHACVAVVHTYYSDPDTQAYLKDLGSMHKVVLEVSLNHEDVSSEQSSRRVHDGRSINIF